jgi:predicted dehydrogenase
MPRQIVSVSGHHFATARPAYPKIYFADRAKGGGAIQDALTHSLNAGEWLVGPIERVTVDAAHQSLADVNVEDTVHLMARHGTVMGAYVLNQYQMPDEFHISVICEGGTLRYEPAANRWRWMDQPNGPWHDETHAPLERDDWFILQANRFLDVVEGRAEPLCTLDEGAQTLRVNLAALRSAEGGCVPVNIAEVAL